MLKPGRSEAARIADQLRRAFDGEAWHGDSLFEILKGVSAKQAAARPVANAHSIWELVLQRGSNMLSERVLRPCC